MDLEYEIEMTELSLKQTQEKKELIEMELEDLYKRLMDAREEI